MSVSTFASSIWFLSTFRMPWSVFRNTGKNTDLAMTRIFAGAPMPSQSTISGSQAMPGIWRIVSNVGPKKRSTRLESPAAIPRTTAATEPYMNACPTIEIETMKSRCRLCWVSICQKAFTVASGDGRKTGWIQPSEVAVCQSARIPSGRISPIQPPPAAHRRR